MSERYSNNTTTGSFSMADLTELAKTLTPKPQPIMAFQGTAAQLAAAVQAERPPTSPLLWGIAPPDPFIGLDVIEEDGWVYIGTTRQLAETRKRWGSLTVARRFAEFTKAKPAAP
jgi:hypothetical protein